MKLYFVLRCMMELAFFSQEFLFKKYETGYFKSQAALRLAIQLNPLQSK